MIEEENEDDKFDELFRKTFHRYLTDKGYDLSAMLTDENFTALIAEFGLRTVEKNKSMDDFIKQRKLKNEG